jgi:putative membrane protein
MRRSRSSLAFESRGVIAMMWWSTGHWFWGVLMMIVFWGALLPVVYMLFRGGSRDERRSSARDLLDQRFARGELSEDGYENRRAVLDRKTTASR